MRLLTSALISTALVIINIEQKTMDLIHTLLYAKPC